MNGGCGLTLKAAQRQQRQRKSPAVHPHSRSGPVVTSPASLTRRKLQTFVAQASAHPVQLPQTRPTQPVARAPGAAPTPRAPTPRATAPATAVIPATATPIQQAVEPSATPGQEAAADTFTIGDAKERVAAVMGVPSNHGQSVWNYGMDSVSFDNSDRVRAASAS
jgi:hypothetical protein